MTRVETSNLQTGNRISAKGVTVASAGSSSPESLFTKAAKALTKEKPADSTPLSEWMNECASSMVDVDRKGNPIYDREVAPFDLAGKEYDEAIAKGDTKKADEIIAKRLQSTAQGDIALYDKIHHDGAIDSGEQVRYDISEYEKKYGTTPPELKPALVKLSQNANSFMDLDGDHKVSDKEYAAFLYAMNTNKDSKLDRGEYVKGTGYFRDINTKEAKNFKEVIKSGYIKLYGPIKN